MTPSQIEFARRLARGIALQFGTNCEVLVHDLEADELDNSIVAIENGHITGRSLGDGPSHVVLEVLEAIKEGRDVEDREPYLARAADGKILKSSTIFIRNDAGKPVGVLAINYDITLLKGFEAVLWSFIGEEKSKELDPEPIMRNVGDLLDELLRECERVVGKPAAIMNKEERVRAIRYLDQRGAFLISKSSEKACEFFGVSKYSFYSYLNEAKAMDEAE